MKIGFGINFKEKNMKIAYIAYACAWIATAIGVSVGIIITKSGACLWRF